jgi:hypothetical protein
MTKIARKMSQMPGSLQMSTPMSESRKRRETLTERDREMGKQRPDGAQAKDAVQCFAKARTTASAQASPKRRGAVSSAPPSFLALSTSFQRAARNRGLETPPCRLLRQASKSEAFKLSNLVRPLNSGLGSCGDLVRHEM